MEKHFFSSIPAPYWYKDLMIVFANEKRAKLRAIEQIAPDSMTIQDHLALVTRADVHFLFEIPASSLHEAMLLLDWAFAQSKALFEEEDDSSS